MRGFSKALNASKNVNWDGRAQLPLITRGRCQDTETLGTRATFPHQAYLR